MVTAQLDSLGIRHFISTAIELHWHHLHCDAHKRLIYCWVPQKRLRLTTSNIPAWVWNLFYMWAQWRKAACPHNLIFLLQLFLVNAAALRRDMLASAFAFCSPPFYCSCSQALGLKIWTAQKDACVLTVAPSHPTNHMAIVVICWRYCWHRNRTNVLFLNCLDETSTFSANSYTVIHPKAPCPCLMPE